MKCLRNFDFLGHNFVIGLQVNKTECHQGSRSCDEYIYLVALFNGRALLSFRILARLHDTFRQLHDGPTFYEFKKPLFNIEVLEFGIQGLSGSHID